MSTVAASVVPDTIRVMLTFPAELLTYFAELAERSNQLLDKVITDALDRALLTKDAAYIITQSHDQQIRHLLGGRVDGADKLLDMIARLKHVNIGGRKVPLSTSTQEALYWAARSMGKEGVPGIYEQLMAEAVSEKFHG